MLRLRRGVEGLGLAPVHRVGAWLVWPDDPSKANASAASQAHLEEGRHALEDQLAPSSSGDQSHAAPRTPLESPCFAFKRSVVTRSEKT